MDLDTLLPEVDCDYQLQEGAVTFCSTVGFVTVGSAYILDYISFVFSYIFILTKPAVGGNLFYSSGSLKTFQFV